MRFAQYGHVDCLLCQRTLALEQRGKILRKSNDLAMLDIVMACHRYLDRQHQKCERCGILVGEHHAESETRKVNSRNLCSECRKQVSRRPSTITQAQKSMVGLWEHWKQSATTRDQEAVVESIKSGEDGWDGAKRKSKKHEIDKTGNN